MSVDIKKLVDRFLSWPLPKSVRSDLCVTTDYDPRSGTNLLTADEARQMLEYVLAAESDAAVFTKQQYGATVATILETDDSVVEVLDRNDGTCDLIVHVRRDDRDQWDDISARLRPEHFDRLGSVAAWMRRPAKTKAPGDEVAQPAR